MIILNKFISILLLTISSVAHSGVLFSTNFEDGTINGLSCSGNCPAITSVNSLGKYSSDFTLTRSSTVNYRTEATLGDNGQFQFGKEYWIQFNYRYENWAKDTDSEAAPFQIHATPGSWDATCSLGSAYSTAPFIMFSQNDEVKFVTYGGKVLWRAAIQKKQWLNMFVHFRISTGSDGFVETWKDGIKIGRVNGPNSPKVDKCGLPMRAPYFKMGVYKWNWKTITTDSTIRTLLMDNLTISDTPLPLTTDTTPPIVSNLVNSLITQTSGTVSWTTDENSKSSFTINGEVQYNSLFVVNHSFNTTNLSPNTSYPFTISVTDTNNNSTNVSGILTTLADTVAPIISNVTTDISYNSVVFSWLTDEKSSSRVKVYNSNYPGTSIYDATLVADHTITILDLPDNTQLNYNIRSIDASGNISNFDGVLRTLPIPDTTPPVISGVVDNLTNSSLTVSWSTDEAATSRVVLDGVEYLDNNLSTSHEVLLPMTFGQHVITVSSKDAAGNASDDVHTITIGACLK